MHRLSAKLCLFNPCGQKGGWRTGWREGRRQRTTERERQRQRGPYYKDHELIGDNLLLRYAEQLLGYKCLASCTVEDTASCRIGYCISGQKIEDLQERLFRSELPVGDKIIILIGTNDMISGTNLASMIENY